MTTAFWILFGALAAYLVDVFVCRPVSRWLDRM